MNFLHFTTNLLPIVTMIVLEPIGFVHNTCTTSQAPEFIKKEISEIEILPEYSYFLFIMKSVPNWSPASVPVK